MNNPYLLFEFANDKNIICPIAFTEPVQVFQTENADEIPAIFDKIQQAVQSGYYAAGYVSYEAAPAFHPAMHVHSSPELPLLWFGIFKEARLPEETIAAEPFDVSSWRSSSSEEEYRSAIQQIKKAIEEGDTYQVNYTERLYADFKGNDFSFYRQLTRNQQADYGAYLNLGNVRILSASPELFFRVSNGRLKAKPMKGTAPRGRFTEEDEAIKMQLRSSEKEQAENLMIVDLLRNDLSRIAKTGSVQTVSLFETETYPTVHQLTSTIEAELKEDATIFDWFQALFPCGSITGAPKISTMKTIAALEKTPREVYCGAIGFITPKREAVFNVPIRTVAINSNTGTASYGVGGGITWDSTAKGEYSELAVKAKLLSERRPEFRLLESLKMENGTFPLLPYHLARLESSSAYFRFQSPGAAAIEKLEAAAADRPSGSFKVRLLADQYSLIEVQAEPLTAIKEPVFCSLARSPVDSSDPFLFHKTTHRKVYEEHQKLKPADAFSVLLWNEHEEITEFTIGNFVAEKDGVFFTPPVSAGLLAGTYRQQLLNEGKLAEKRIRKDELEKYDALWFINSIRGWLKVELLSD